MQFRIRSLMIEIGSFAILMAIWHLAPKSRFIALTQMTGFYLMHVPQMMYFRKHPGTWPMRRILGYTAYCAVVLAGMLALLLLFPDVNETLATWPG